MEAVASKPKQQASVKVSYDKVNKECDSENNQFITTFDLLAYT